jgi:hypothetical protein
MSLWNAKGEAYLKDGELISMKRAAELGYISEEEADEE